MRIPTSLCNNVLVDPTTGSCVVIDIDSLVVPGVYPPEVIGTGGYIAPEVLETLPLPFGDPQRKLPCASTDLHSMAVLIYEYLLLRHPLRGPKSYSEDPNLDDFLCMGPKALFIEDPKDQSNRPRGMEVTIKDLGPELEKLFIRAFVDGLHNPNERPTAMEWEKALVKTWDLLHPCENPNCGANGLCCTTHPSRCVRSADIVQKGKHCPSSPEKPSARTPRAVDPSGRNQCITICRCSGGICFQIVFLMRKLTAACSHMWLSIKDSGFSLITM